MAVKSATKQELALKDQILINRMIFQRKEYHSVFALYHNKTSKIIADFQKRQGQIPGLVWDRSQSVKQKVKEATDELKKNLRTLIKNDQQFAWNKSNDETDKMVKAFTKNLPLSKTKKAGMFTRNAQALTGFMNRKNALGKTVSDNVWNIAEQARDQLGYYVNSGIGTGRSASNIANDLLACLNNPDQTFHRIRDDKGNLIPSKPMANYHPPRGVYKSPYKNALRLSATETNMAYNLADHDRWNRLDFVIGIQVHISNNHPETDICDSGAGLYSKTFKFMGWHPSCRCYATPVLQKPEDFMRDIKQKTRTAEQVQGVPDSLLKWMKTNSETIDRMKTKPYWITANSTKGVFNFTESSAINGVAKIAGIAESEAFTLSDSMKERISNSDDIGGMLGQSDWNKEFKRLGYTEKEIEDTKLLLQQHGLGEDAQARADKLIMDHIKNPNSRIGAVLRSTVDMETKAYKAWAGSMTDRMAIEKAELLKEWNDSENYMQAISGRNSFEDQWEDIVSRKYEKKKVYRGGSIGQKDIEPWTTNPRGAKSGSSYFGVDHIKTIDELLDEGYSILGGPCRMMGAPGEGEITFIKWPPKIRKK